MEAASIPQEGTEPEAGAEPQETQADPGVDLSPVYDRLDQIDGTVRDWIESQDAARQEPGYQAGEPADDRLYYDAQGNIYDAQGNPIGQPSPDGGLGPQQLEALLERAEQRAEQRVMQQVAPELETIREERFNRQVDDLLESYPALRDKETAANVVQAAQQLAHELGQPELWRSPRMVELVHLAEVARQRSDAEVPAGDGQSGGVQLEGAGGASPQGQQLDEAEEMLRVHRGQNPTGFSFM